MPWQVGVKFKNSILSELAKDDPVLHRFARDTYHGGVWADVRTHNEAVTIAASAFVLAIILVSCGWPT